MWYSIAWASLVGGLLCLDRVLIQVLVSRPVVAGPIVGMVLGDVVTGLIAGAFIELLWIDRLPVGAYIPPNDSVVAVLAAAGSIIAGERLAGTTREMIALSVLLFVPLGLAWRRIDTWIGIRNNLLSRRAAYEAERLNLKRIERIHMKGLIAQYGITVLVIFLSLAAAGFLLMTFYPLLGEPVRRALLYVYFFLPVLGVAVAISTVKTRGAVPLFAGIFLVIFMARSVLW